MTTSPPPNPRRLIVLGSTGSIGVSALEVVRSLDEEMSDGPRFEVVGLAAGRRLDALKAQCERFEVREAAIALDSAGPESPDTVRIRTGTDSALELVRDVARPGDLLVAAMVGAAGIPAVLEAIERGCDIALANKETLVAAGAIVTQAAARNGVEIIPIDSEHAAVHQCLRSAGREDEISRIVLTASGGPFRTWDAKRIAEATIEEALEHPTWKMGPKVTIDSASMMNKGLEIIEAHWLFGVDADRLDAIIHPQSIVHSFVEFVDGSSLAQLSPPDMRMPIQYAMCHPRRVPGCAPPIDYAALRELVFEPVDHQRFPAIEIARDAIRSGGTAGAIFNAANESAVEAFLKGRIRFGMISEMVTRARDTIESIEVVDFEDILDADRRTRELIRKRCASLRGRD